MRWRSFLLRVVSVTALGGSAACYDVYDLGLQGPTQPLAVGASATYVLQYSKFFDCRSDRVVRCGAGNYNQITQTTSISVDDPSRLMAVLAVNGDINVRALSEGTVKLTATGIDAKGQTQTESRSFYLMPPQSATVNLPGSCISVAAAQTLTVPVGADVPLDLTVRSGTNALYANGWMPAIDAGQLTLLSGTYPFSFKAPSTPTDTQIRIPLQQPFALPVRVYDPAGIDGVGLYVRTPAPTYNPGTEYVLDMPLTVGGVPICQEPTVLPVRSVSILTPDMCSFWTGYGGTVMILPSPQESMDLRSVRVMLVNKPGVCRIGAGLKGMAMTATVEMTSSVK